MSDAMTNREIEDVLTSIRRLVAQEGTRPAETGRLILTEAQRIAPEVVAEARSDSAVDAAPLAHEGSADPRGDLDLPEPDFGKLEATIAELEAAVSASGGAWEPDGAQVEAPRASNVTELYGRLSFQHRHRPPEGEAVEAETEAVADAPHQDAGASDDAAVDDTVMEGEAEAVNAPDEGAPDEAAEEEVIDEAMLRALIAQIVREELHGQLGERITLQVRKLVRAEIAKALDERKFL